MALETECNLRPNLGTSADVPDVPSRTSMITDPDSASSSFVNAIFVAFDEASNEGGIFNGFFRIIKYSESIAKLANRFNPK